MVDAELLAKLPTVFRFTDAVAAVSERQLRNLAGQAQVVQLARGLYRKHDLLSDDDLIEIASKARLATICLRSALARHDLIDDIPAFIDIAIPRGTWKPVLQPPVRWHYFDQTTFELGRDLMNLSDSLTIGLYSPERSVIDAYRLRYREGSDMANEALKRWLKAGGQPSVLLNMALAFPRTLPVLRSTLEVLL